MRKVVINLAVSPAAKERLRVLADESKVALGVVLERAIMAYQHQGSESDAYPVIDVLESRLLKMEAAMESLESRLSAFADRAASLPTHEEKSAEIASESASDVLAEPVPPKKKSRQELMEQAIQEIIATGERSPTRIAERLNALGHKNGAGGPVRKSDSKISKALKALKA